MADPAQIQDLLHQSLAAHGRYRDNLTRAVSNGTGGVSLIGGDPVVSKAALVEAARLRQQAHDLDPEHRAPAWSQEYLHGQLMAFYDGELGKP